MEGIRFFFHLLPLAVSTMKCIHLEQLGDAFSGALKKFIIISIYSINPFQSTFSANRILPSSYLFWAVKRLVDYF
jgi:hypothetical protein